MILSMTGFGQASGSYNDRNISIEIKSLNGKSADMRLKVPSYYKEKEMEIRKIIMGKLLRGKIEVSIVVTSENEDVEYSLNKTLLKMYAANLKEAAKETGIDSGDIIQSVIRIPNVVQVNDQKISAEEWKFSKELMNEALRQITEFRKTEGHSLHVDMTENINLILNFLHSVSDHEDERLVKLKARMTKNLNEFLGKENVDKNRFEQEVLHYLERLDINEEKIRLEQHCKYFLEELSSDQSHLGKKLGFIAQEIGREINTMGAKAQYSEIQKLVVNMKDHLEKIKEQVANAV